MWLTKFKIALVEKDIDKLINLMDELPELDNNKDREQAIYLMKEASELVSILKEKTSKSMKQIKKNLDFLKSVEHRNSNRLDIVL